jgi:hypothetical protein
MNIVKDEVRETLQIRALTAAIRRYPHEPANYLLRGEERLAQGLIEAAAEDFQAVLVYAEPLLASSAWGYIYQAYLDRATAGLRQCL